MALSDEDLIRTHQQGDAAAFGELVRRYANSLLGYLMRMSENRQQAEDLFQETFRKVHQKAGFFKGRGQFKAWLFAIATNVALDGLRKKSRQPQLISLNQNDESDSDCPESAVAVADEKSVAPFEAAVLAEQKARVRRAINQLPPRQRNTLILAYYQQLTYRQVAQVLGCTLGTVKSQMYRAMKTLAELLPEEAGGGQ